jgi:uncharacterized NAD(P)/FAD-binding protein YdhS
MNNKKTISIIGAGATGIGLVNQIIRSLPVGLDINDIRILIFDSHKKIEGGNAYSKDIYTNLMNTKCGTIDRVYGEGYGILEWSKNNKNKWKAYMLGSDIDKDSYIPRTVVGLYLADLLDFTIEKAKNIGIDIHILNDEVTDISKNSNNYKITTKSNTYYSRYIYLALGHLDSKKNISYQYNKCYYHNPYPINKLIAQIPKEATVGIIGSRLSAIDVSLGLSAGGHTGKIISISRQGRLPAVRAEQGSYTFKDLGREKLTSLLLSRGFDLRLHEIVNMLKKEIIHAEGRELKLHDVMRKDLSPIEYYENEVYLSKGKERPWQAAIYATNGNIDLLWHYLHEEDKQALMSSWSNDWLTYRASIPRENAEKILSMMQSGKLSVEGNSDGFSYNEKKNKFELHRKNGKTSIEVDYLVSAAGSENDIQKANSQLLENLLAKGMITPHKYGGINCCFASGRIFPSSINEKSDENCRIFAVGPLTSGVYFFTTALEVIERQVKNRAIELSFMLASDIYKNKVKNDIILSKNTPHLEYLPNISANEVKLSGIQN